MNDPNQVNLLLFSGAMEDAQRFAQTRYPNSTQIVLSKRAFHETGWLGKLRQVQKLKGKALIIFSDSSLHIDQPKLMLCASLFHRCGETVFADTVGGLQAYRRQDLLWKLPQLVVSAVIDGFVLIASWLLLNVFSAWFHRRIFIDPKARSVLDVAYLYPFPLQKVIPGGEMSYLKGCLSGLQRESARCEVFAGCALPIEQYPVHMIPNRRRLYLLRESQALSYNLRYVRVVTRALLQRPPRIIYQRHGRLVLAGAILSRFLHIPLVLEYQCSEYWRVKHWDPGHFHGLIRLCEDLTISSTSLFVVLSEVLRDELLARGVPAERIIVNPAAVDAEQFRPASGGHEMRRRLGFGADEVVVGFLGSFSYYHGIPVLQDAIARVLARTSESRKSISISFLLIGDGVLRPEMQDALTKLGCSDRVVFTGAVQHDSVPSHLDACDILVSPHMPMPDRRPFFGSPSKLFEYMAMGKAIVASDMDQLAEVLSHGNTAWLVAPGSAQELSEGIELLAANPRLRRDLGLNVRRTAVEHHSWQQNAARLLSKLTSPLDDLAPILTTRDVPHWDATRS